jgi:hypothetical protein
MSLTAKSHSGIMLALFLSLFAVSAFAGTSDNLGLSAMWGTISGWITDGYLTKIIGLIFFAVGVQRAFMGSILQFFFMLGLSLLVINADAIMSTMFSAII